MTDIPIRSFATNKACGYVIDSEKRATDCAKSSLFIKEGTYGGIGLGFIIGVLIVLFVLKDKTEGYRSRRGNRNRSGRKIFDINDFMTVVFCMMVGGVIGFATASAPDTISMFKYDKIIIDKLIANKIPRDDAINDLTQRRMKAEEIRSADRRR